MKLRAPGTIIQLSAILASAAIIAGASYSLSAKDKDDRRDDRDDDSYTIGLFGDMPYNAMGRAQYPALLADINRSRVVFSVFDGDLKAGGDGPCSNSLYITSSKFQHSQSACDLCARRQRLDRLLGTLRNEQLPYSDPKNAWI